MVILIGCPLVPFTLILRVPGVHENFTSGPAVYISVLFAGPSLVNAEDSSRLTRLSGVQPLSTINPPSGDGWG
jgi:hypothetical protein